MAFEAFLLNNRSLILMVYSNTCPLWMRQQSDQIWQIREALLRSKVKGENPLLTSPSFMEAAVDRLRLMDNGKGSLPLSDTWSGWWIKTLLEQPHDWPCFFLFHSLFSGIRLVLAFWGCLGSRDLQLWGNMFLGLGGQSCEEPSTGTSPVMAQLRRLQFAHTPSSEGKSSSLIWITSETFRCFSKSLWLGNQAGKLPSSLIFTLFLFLFGWFSSASCFWLGWKYHKNGLPWVFQNFRFQSHLKLGCAKACGKRQNRKRCLVAWQPGAPRCACWLQGSVTVRAASYPSGSKMPFNQKIHRAVSHGYAFLMFRLSGSPSSSTNNTAGVGFHL